MLTARPDRLEDMAPPEAPPIASTPAARRPGPLGAAYVKLWTAAAVSFVGDGIHNTALPLLAATLTRDPLGIAAVGVAGQLPWLLLALPGGALVDRWDRRRVLWRTDAYRCLIVAGLAGGVLAGWASIPLLGAAGFLLTAGGTLFTPAAQSILPSLVSRAPTRLERANGRLTAAQTAGWHFLGPPAGGLLFSLARSLPFLADAASFAVSAALLARIPGRFAPKPSPAIQPAPRAAREPAPAGAASAGTDPRQAGPREPARPARPHAGLRVAIAEGLRWLAGHRLLRTLAIVAAIQQLGLAAWSSILVLFAQDRLGLGSLGYGLLWTGVAAGSLLGSLLAARLGRALGTGGVLRASAVTLGAATLAIGVTTSPLAAGSLLGALGMALTIWNVASVSLRQAIVPDRLVGRVNSVFQQLSMGMLPVGAALGGVLGHALGLRAPFLIWGAVLLATALLAMPAVTNRTIEAARGG